MMMMMTLPTFYITYSTYCNYGVLLQLVEAIVLPMTHKERFENLGIAPPKGKDRDSWKIKKARLLITY